MNPAWRGCVKKHVASGRRLSFASTASVLKSDVVFHRCPYPPQPQWLGDLIISKRWHVKSPPP